MDAAPEIVAVSAAREVTDHARAMKGLSDNRYSVERFVVGLLSVVVVASAVYLPDWLGVVAAPLRYYVIGGIQILFLMGITLCSEVFRLRRRVNAITYLLLEQERKSNKS